MKIVVAGGSGLIGTKLVHRLRERGHETIAASPSSGVDTLTGEGLAGALAGAQAVVDVTNSPAFDDTAVLNFFETSTRNILAAEKVATVKHHVVLSIVGADRLPDSGYMRAKVAQENLVRANPVPFTVLHATQFFEFLGVIAGASTDQNTVRLSPALVPANGTIELAGPERFRLDELIRRYLNAVGDPRQVITDPDARYFGAKLEGRSLLPGDNPRIGSIRFGHWLDRDGGLRA